MAVNYAYNYAIIDTNTGMCIQVETSTEPDKADGIGCIEIPVYDQEYLLKYYIDGNWYEDAAGTIPWQSSLL